MPDSQMPDVFCSFFMKALPATFVCFFIKKQTMLVDSGCRRIKHRYHILFMEL